MTFMQKTLMEHEISNFPGCIKNWKRTFLYKCVVSYNDKKKVKLWKSRQNWIKIDFVYCARVVKLVWLISLVQLYSWEFLKIDWS